MLHWHPTSIELPNRKKLKGQWKKEPFNIKEHSVYKGDWLATYVVRPVFDPETDEIAGAIPVGVRILNLRDRIVKDDYCLPGKVFFAKITKTKQTSVSEAHAWMFLTDRLGGIARDKFGAVLKAPAKETGVFLSTHWLREIITPLISLAKESYAAYIAEKRAAA